jgi:hypothetical protein
MAALPWSALASAVPSASRRLSISESTRLMKKDATEWMPGQVDAGGRGLLQAGQVGVHDRAVALLGEDQGHVDRDARGRGWR